VTSAKEGILQQELRGNSLSLTFAGQPEPVDWEVGFRTSAANRKIFAAD